MENFLHNVSVKLPCRDQQLKELFSLIGEEDEVLPPSIYVYGSTSTGKSACVDSTIRYLGYKHVSINTVECYSSKLLFETILNNLSDHKCDRENGYSPAYKCDNMKEFIYLINNILENYNRPVIIVFDKAERLRDMEQNVLPTFLRLKEFCKFNVCSILISQIAFEKYYLKTGLREPFKIFFPQYNNNELYQIISLNRQNYTNYVLCQTNCDNNLRELLTQTEYLFSNYLNAFLMVFYRPCRDLVELRHMAKMNYVKYCEPILDGTTQAEDVTKLWRHIAPILKTTLESLYLRVQPNKNFKVSNEDPMGKTLELRMERLGITSQSVQDLKNVPVTDELTSAKLWAQSFELPFYAKFLLIASYLASYNPVKEDKRLFMKYHGKQRKRLQQVNAKAKISEKLNEQLGPKYFTLDRLLAIFYSIVEERASLTANLICQVPALVALRLISSSSDHSRYRCTAPAQLVTTVAHSLGFNLRKYLYDYI